MRKFLIATTALMLMSATANASNLWEEGIAATLFYEANCGGGIPRDMLMVAKIYERDHPAQIQHRIDEIMSDLKSDVFSVQTTTKIWCATMRPTIVRLTKICGDRRSTARRSRATMRFRIYLVPV